MAVALRSQSKRHSIIHRQIASYDSQGREKCSRDVSRGSHRANVGLYISKHQHLTCSIHIN